MLIQRLVSGASTDYDVRLSFVDRVSASLARLALPAASDALKV
jgi:hypothetical protein